MPFDTAPLEQMAVNNRTGTYFFYIYKLILCYLFGSYTEAVENADQAEKYENSVTGMLDVPVFCFYDALTQLAIYGEADRSQKILEKVQANQAKMQNWAHHAPMNFQHKYDLVEAERWRVLDSKLAAIEYYDRAISGAKANGYVNEEALANELAAKFYLEWGKEKVAQAYMQEAYYCYARWGAKAKVAQIVGKNDYDISIPEEAEWYRLCDRRVMASGEAELHIIETHQQADGTQRWLDTNKIPLRDPDNNVIGILATIEDITERKQAEAVLQEKEQFLRSIYDGVEIAIFVLDVLSDGSFRYAAWNPASEKASGIRSVDIAGKTVTEVMGEEQGERLQQRLAEIVTTGINADYEERLSLQGQETWWFANLNPIKNVEGRVYRIIGTSFDISDRKLAEFQLQRQAQADQLLASIAQSINQSVRLDQVMKNCLEQVRQFYQSDRVLICRFDADYNVVIELEVLSQPELSLLGQTIVDPCFDQTWAERYRQGYITACNDSQAVDITPCYAEFLAQMQVQANLSVGILGNDQIWGMMIVHHCHTTHIWQQSEIDLLKQLGLQIGIAHQKANLYTQLETELAERRLAELALQQKSLLLQQALTDLQNAQLQMVQSEKMSALGNLVAGVAHEMNNPLGFIAASLTQAKPTLADIVKHLKLYQENLPNPAEEIIEHAKKIDLDYSLSDLPKMIDSMSMACDRLENISTSLRTFSRADQDYKVPFNIHEGIDSTILILKHRIKDNEQRPAIEVVTNYSNLPQIQCFPGQLNQVFMNLIANAIDARAISF